MSDSNNPSHPPSVVGSFGVSWPLLIAFLVLLGLLGSVGGNAILGDPDVYWHLATGQWILDHGSVPRADPFSHSALGSAWMPHHWLSEVIMALLYQRAGWAGLVVFVALLVAGTLAYLTRFLLHRMEPVHALLFVALAASLSMGHLLVRPHVFIWPLLVIWVGELVKAAEQGSRPPWWLLPVMTLWANLHGSFTLGLVLSGALAVDAVFFGPDGRRGKAAWPWLVFVGLSVLAAMLTPSGWQGLWHSVHAARLNSVFGNIVEWQSPDFHQFQPLEVWLMLMLAIACSGRVQLPWWRLLLVLALVHLALHSRRHVSVLGLVSPLLLAAPLATCWRTTRGAGGDAESLDRFFRILGKPARPGAIAGFALSAGLLIAAALYAKPYAPPSANTPQDAVNAALASGVNGPVLNAYNFGGYLIFRDIPVFIDGRAEQLYGSDLAREYVVALELAKTESLPKLLDKYRIGWTLLQPGTPALALLDHMPGWRRIHADAVAVVHVRDGQLPIR